MQQSNHHTLSYVIAHKKSDTYTSGKEIWWKNVHQLPESMNLTIQTELFVCGRLSWLGLSVWIWLSLFPACHPLSYFLHLCIKKNRIKHRLNRHPQPTLWANNLSPDRREKKVLTVSSSISDSFMTLIRTIKSHCGKNKSRAGTK